MSVGLVIVSHSQKLAEGVRELAAQMAGGTVDIRAVGGAADGSLGTNAEAIATALRQINADGILVLMDLGSAVLSTETALELVGEDIASRVVVSNAPLVEGTVTAALQASIGSSLEEVASVAEQAREMTKIEAAET